MLTVSNYHYIRNNFDAKYPSIFGVTPLKFKEQLLLLKNEGDIIKPKELLKDIDGILQSSENKFLITFDDGLKEQFDFAVPILDELDIQAIFFVNSMNHQEKKVSTVHKIHLLRSIISTSEFLEKIYNIDGFSFSNSEKDKAEATYIYDDKNSAVLKYILNFKLTFNQQEKIVKELFDIYFNEDEVLSSLYMSEYNIKELAKINCLGSHTHSHCPLGLQTSDVIKFELENSKTFLQKLTNSNIDMVSYPYGTAETCTNEVAAFAKEEGYQIGFTTKRGKNTFAENQLLLNRFDCNDLPGGKNYR
ncbi:polysaccharide deacetylase [Flavobacterium sp. 90]|uniref:polysaccharide deacetylase family protein n=1 Tax=unclassified Flavobacterium TaxID=196869 RepID=UPI000EADD0FE|nr:MULTISPECIES: polysaccharide deacetylase family protein [unclassified Flavobacterium]RKR10948.1 polysaccharide deacetylase [Flavobacterium sp. 81]TCK54732.1 polysaccharide deacetylase [Flavobacterium sp. 90]